VYNLKLGGSVKLPPALKLKHIDGHMKMSHMGFIWFAICVLAATASLAQPSQLSNWKALAEGGTEVELVSDPAPPVPGGQGTNSLRITARQTDRRFGIVCADMGKAKLQTGDWYDLSFNVRMDTRKTSALTVSPESPNGEKVAARTTLPEVGRSN
jgi:hypothetical protein